VRSSLAALMALVSVGALGACGDKAASTLLVVNIKTDLLVTGQMDEVRLKVRRPDNKGERDLTFPLTAASKFPLTAGLIPASGGEAELLTLIAQGFKGNNKLVQTEVQVEFRPGKWQIDMFLAAACMTDPCQGNDQTCSAGGSCIPRRRSSVPLGVPTTDAGTTDTAPGVDAPVGMDAPITDAPIGIDAPDAPLGDDAGNCTCPSDDNPCTQDFCMGGTCRHVALGNRFGCPGGLCIDGACCTGCIDNMGRCRVGNNALFCGNAARDCVVCNDQDVCTQDGCDNGVCKTAPLSGGACPTGVCLDGQCRCGGPMQPCCGGTTCPGGSCVNGSCGECGGDGQPCCNSGMGSGNCGPGLLCENDKCGKCGEVGQPCCSDGCRTGVCGGAARICQPCGGASQPCCPTGDACGANLACTNGNCNCGGQGQPCCGGTMCTSDNNACNGVEMCTNGVCGRSAPVTCTAASQCHMPGLCDPASGRCSTPLRPNGSMCSDGNACTTGDVCRDGACVAGAAMLCNDNRPCTDDVCVPATGCTFPPSPKGKACIPPTPCRADACNDSGSCVATAANEGVSCSTATGGPGRCVGGGCCPSLVPTGMCPVPF
jgi:hypothetical protein